MELHDYFIEPGNCSKEQIDQFYKLIKNNGNVKKIGLKKRIMLSKLLAFCYVENDLAGIGALKKPSKQYIKKIFLKSKTKQDYNNFEYEIGYFFINKLYRKSGIGFLLTEKLINFSGNKPIIAITKYDNSPAQYLLAKFGFIKAGNQYKSKKNYYQVFIKT